jgi:pimeloyl-ACP methyl ester carboxylesterase
VWAAIGIGIFAGIVAGYQVSDVDESVFATDATVSVSRDGGQLSFAPAGSVSRAGVLFFPGARVAPEAYAPLARTLARDGYRVVLVSLPLRLAPTKASVDGVMAAALRVVDGDPAIRHWIAAGHSKGGKLAACLAHAHPERLAGLVLMGTSHPAAACDLAAFPHPVTKLVATRDGLASPDEVAANARYLPSTTRWVRIAGGNHAQFGYYRYQLGDHAAAISRAAQQDAVVAAMLEMLNKVQ